MSKSFGLAGIRLGIAFASKPVIDYLMKVKAPYNINALTSKTALEAFDHTADIEKHIKTIKDERKRLRAALADLPNVKHIHKSDANFLLLKIDGAHKIYGKLASWDIIVRYRGDEPGCDDCLRITVGTKEENRQLINALKRIS
jgi:histidinol-phosphate aminotransferase